MKENGQKVIRQRLTFTGDVQGVGFRYRARMAAQEIGVTGWVENQWDGSVIMEVQGNLEQIYRLIKSINQGTWIDIRQVTRKELPLEDHEYYFEVRGY